MTKYNILIWGTGERARNFMERNIFNECSIIGFIDTYQRAECFKGYEVYKPEHLESLLPNIDYVVIATEYFAEILEFCRKRYILWDKFVITDHIEDPVYEERWKPLEYIAPLLYQEQKRNAEKYVSINICDRSLENCLVGKGKYSRWIYIHDYFRYRTFEFCAQEIEQQNTGGAVAERGVFRGEFASLINETFPDRKMYLFDTFEGFDAEEAGIELALGRADESFVEGHKDTSVERVLGNLPKPEQCIVCKGLFPDSITSEAEKEKYAFVSLDVDFEESTFQGLKFFYPRLSENGYIFLHDYNANTLGGIKEAVARYEREYGMKLKKVPLADWAGTLIITK